MGKDTPAVANILVDYDSGAQNRAVLDAILRQTLSDWHCHLPQGWELPPDDPRFSVGTAPAPDLPCLVLVGPTALEPTALETGLWFLDSHKDYGVVRGRLERIDGAKSYPNDFQAKNVWKRPALLGSAFLLRRIEAGIDGRRAALELLADGLRGCFTAQRFGSEFEQLPAEELGSPAPDSIHLGPSKPVHDCFRTVPTSRGISRPAEGSGEHVVFVVPHFAMGGSDKFTLDLARELCRQHGMSVSFVSTLSREDAWWREFAELTDELYPLQCFLTRPDFPRFVRDHILAKQPLAVVVTHSQLGYQLLPFLRSECPEIPFVDYLHIEEMEWREGGYPALSLQHGEHLDRTMVSSEHLRQWMTDRGGQPERISVHTTNIDPDDWDPDAHDAEAVRSRLGLGADDCLVLFAGRLVEQKRPRLLGDIVRLAAQNPSLLFHVAVAGDGPESDWLEEFWKQHRLASKVSMLGRVSPAEIKPLLAAADVFLLPSQNEGIALALYEAMAMRCAVVGADVGGQSELVSEGCGFLISPEADDQAAAYAEVITDLIGDEQKRDSTGSRARSRIESNFSLRNMGNGISQLLREIGSIGAGKPLSFCQNHLDEVIEQFRLEQMLYEAQAAVQKANSGSDIQVSEVSSAKVGKFDRIIGRIRRKGVY